VPRVVSLAVLYGLWELAARPTKNPTFIPSPAAAWHQLLRTSSTHDATRGYSGQLRIEHLGVSLRRILIGSAIGISTGLKHIDLPRTDISPDELRSLPEYAALRNTIGHAVRAAAALS